MNDATTKLNAAATSNPGMSKLTRKKMATRNRPSRPHKILPPSKNRSLGRRPQSQTARSNSAGSNAFAGIEHFSSSARGGKPVYWSLRQEKIWSKNRDIQDPGKAKSQMLPQRFSACTLKQSYSPHCNPLFRRKFSRRDGRRTKTLDDIG